MSAQKLRDGAAAGDVAAARQAWIEARVGWERPGFLPAGLFPNSTGQKTAIDIVQLAYEVGESKMDGGESRVSGTSLNDMRNNVDGIDVAWRAIFAFAVEETDQQLAGNIQRRVDGLKTMVSVSDLTQVDPDELTTATEELVVKLQNAAPLLGLKRPALEADGQR